MSIKYAPSEIKCENFVDYELMTIFYWFSKNVKTQRKMKLSISTELFSMPNYKASTSLILLHYVLLKLNLTSYIFKGNCRSLQQSDRR